MATVKGYSVAKLRKASEASVVNTSTVYSLSSENQAANLALNDAYGRTDRLLKCWKVKFQLLRWVTLVELPN